MLRWFNNLKIQNKLFLAFSPLFFIGILSITYFFYNVAERNILNKTSEANLNVLRQISDKVGIINNNIQSVSNMYFLDGNIRRLLKTDWSDKKYEENVTYDKVKSVFDTVNNNFEYLKHSTTLLGFNNNYYRDDGTNNLEKDRMRSVGWLDKFAEDQNKMVLADTYRDGDKFIFSAVSYLRDVYSGKALGLLILDFNEDVLLDTYRNLDNMDVMIINANGKIISGKNKDKLTTSVAGADYFQKLSSYQSGYFISKAGGRDIVVSFYKMPQWDWYVIDVHPLSSLLEGMSSIKKYIYWIALAELLILFGLCYMFSYAISSPLKKLVSSIQLASTGNLNHLLDVRRKDEIGILVAKYNTMLERIGSLVQEIVEQHEMKRKAEIQGLQAQMNPHFLYNTLSSIRWLVKSGQLKETDQAIISLVRLLRQTFHASGEFITFAEERKFLADYMLIQKIRYGGKFEIVYDFEDNIAQYRTLRLMLQPILENAIFHGIEPKDGNGTIAVKAFAQGGDIVVEVADDGVGMDASRRLSYGEAAAAGREPSSGLGIANIEQRLKLHFGESYGLAIDSEKNRGTRVTITIPKIKSEGA